ncbi:MAG: hypothetical protein KatS3mg076_0018 [Candidatus Binatia bacterium]|nr:MAG: hypothetical protein KatS3mg076_0018 [Candidatus Binatia bacterium]
MAGEEPGKKGPAEEGAGTGASKATGSELFADDRWLVTNILSSSRWARGTAEELLCGEAWRTFTRRLERVAERILDARVPPYAVDRADGYRYVATLLRNALDVAIEEHDPDRPRVRWLTRRNKIGYDCADALYGYAEIRPDATYRLRGNRGSVHFFGLQVMSSIRNLHNAHADEWEVEPDGSFELVASPARQPGNWIPLGAGADTIWFRQFFYDWENEVPARLSIERVDPGPRGNPNGRLDPADFARRLDAVAANVEANVELWFRVAVAQREHLRNRFPEKPFGGAAMGAQKHQTAGTGYFALEDDEALVVEVRPPRAKYWSLHLCNFWLESLDYAHHQSSLNGHQAVLDPDGVFRAVVCLEDPGVANWLDPVGHREGTMIYRWNLADDAPVPETRVVPRARLREYLPPGTRFVSPEERARAIEVRRAHVLRRMQVGG